MTEALVDAVGETLLEVKAKALGDTQADVNAKKKSKLRHCTRD